MRREGRIVEDGVPGRDNALVGLNPGNFLLRSSGKTMEAIIFDPDMAMTVDQIKNPAPNSVPKGRAELCVESRRHFVRFPDPTVHRTVSYGPSERRAPG